MFLASFAVLPLFAFPLLARLLLGFQLLSLLRALTCKKRKRGRYRDEGKDDVGVHSCAFMQRSCSASRFVHRPEQTLFGLEQSILVLGSMVYIFHMRMPSHAPW